MTTRFHRRSRIALFAGFCAFSMIGAFLSQAAAAQAPAPAPDYSAYILTPPPGPAPRLTGAKIFGVRPGSPFLFAITATGDRPMTFAADNLPAGLTLDPATGQITGVLKDSDRGDHLVTVHAKNAAGTVDRPLKIVVGDQIALTPPMGWNSWNSFAGNVRQQDVEHAVNTFIAKGLINHGWSYINIDDTWQGTRTGADHALGANDKFPDMKGMIDHIHSLGLKAGIYTTPWITSYAGYPGGSSDNPDGAWDKASMNGGTFHHIGMYHFMAADARQWAQWGFDYLKYDWDSQKVPDIKEMSDALRNSGRDIVYSLSNSLNINLGADLDNLANAWRTTGDVQDVWGRTTTDTYHNGIAQIAFQQDQWAPYAGPGHWIDPDMLVVGFVSVGSAIHSTRLTPDEQYTHISLWCLLSAPLLIGCDMDRLDDFTLSLLTNDEILDLDQDTLGKQAVEVFGPRFVPAQTPPGVPANPMLPQLTLISDQLKKLLANDPDAKAVLDKYPDLNLLTGDATGGNNPGGNALVYRKELEDGSIAVGLFNVGPKEETVTANWADLKLTGSQKVRDLWRQKDLGNFTDTFSASVPSHGVVLVKISPAK